MFLVWTAWFKWSLWYHFSTQNLMAYNFWLWGLAKITILKNSIFWFLAFLNDFWRYWPQKDHTRPFHPWVWGVTRMTQSRFYTFKKSFLNFEWNDNIFDWLSKYSHSIQEVPLWVVYNGCFCFIVPKVFETNLDFRYQYVENLTKQRYPVDNL